MGSNGIGIGINFVIFMDRSITMKKFLKQLFCKHIDALEDRIYLHSEGMRILGEFHPLREIYLYKFTCVKCERTRLISKSIDVL